MKVALVYDRLNKWGGAERVLLALHQIWPEAPLFTSVYDPVRAPWAKVFQVNTSFAQKLPIPKNAHELYPFLMGPAFETFNFDKFDVVISVTSEFAKAVLTKPGTLHVCYCLTPVGYLWTNRENYFSQLHPVMRRLAGPLVNYLRWYDGIVARRPDHYIAISRAVQKRIRTIYAARSDVIYPPVDSPQTVAAARSGSYFLIVARLVPNKRLDIAVDAFNELGLPLKIVGTGRLAAKLRSRAGRNIEFLGQVEENRLARLYQDCRALVIPGEEDFGIVSVEAQSYGRPVLAYGAGGSLETVIPGKTGWFFSQQKADDLIQLIRSVDWDSFSAVYCREQAEKFGAERFKTEFESAIVRLYTDYKRNLA